jgi:hypothetical protein
MSLKRMLAAILPLIGACFLLGSLPALAVNNQGGAFYRAPAEVRLQSLIRRRFPSFYGGRPGQELIVERFYPIGWSRDGKLAYYVEPGDEACGCYFAKLIIKDLKSDKVLWQFDYDSSDLQDTMKNRTPESLAALWRYKRDLFNSKLREHNIVAPARFALSMFPAIYEGDQLTADLKTKEATREEQEQSLGVIKSALLQLSSKRKGRKTIFEQTYKTDESLPLDMKVLGYLKSPFEPRVAVVMAEVWRGYEGPPHTTHTTVVGSTLDTGFK